MAKNNELDVYFNLAYVFGIASLVLGVIWDKLLTIYLVPHNQGVGFVEPVLILIGGGWIFITWYYQRIYGA